MKESIIMASRVLSLLTLSAIGGLALQAFGTPAKADEDPGYRAPRYHYAPTRQPQRVRTITQTRTVWRTRAVCYDYAGQPFDCRYPAPVLQQPRIIGYTYSYQCGSCAAAVPIVPPVQYYAPYAEPCGACAPAYIPRPRYDYSACGACAQPALYVYGHGYHRYGHRHGNRHRHHRGSHLSVYGYAVQ
jgi:hypothetical protein